MPAARAGRWRRNTWGGRSSSSGPDGKSRAYAQSRRYVERGVGDGVRALPNVTIRDQCEVAGLVATPARDRVTGARVLPRAGGAERILAADLVADATGRSGRTPAWLKGLGGERAVVGDGAGEPVHVQVVTDLQVAVVAQRQRGQVGGA